tara:strand:+ start:1047 stop:1595 length:549 start_codon:yes stop_codon:yes gene_type:complete
MTSLRFLPSDRPRQRVYQLMQEVKVSKDGSDAKKKSIDRFWNTMYEDLLLLEKHSKDPHPFDGTCYERCGATCVRHFDTAYWRWRISGFRPRRSVNQFGRIGRLLSLVFVFAAGVFKMWRANQDGGVSFYGTTLNIMTHALGAALLFSNGEGLLAMPKLLGLFVSAFILFGMLRNVEDSIGI